MFFANEDEDDGKEEKEDDGMVDDLIEIQERMARRKREVEETSGFTLDKI